MLFVTLGWFAGGFVNGVAGFGAAMIAMPLIAPFIDLSIAVPSCTLIILSLNFQVSWTFRSHIEWRFVKEIFIGAIPGVMFSVFILDYISETYLKAGMGAFIACYALWSLYEETNCNRIINPSWGYLSGFLSSTLGMAFGFNGPPLAAYIAYSGCRAKSVKGTIGAGFIITGVFIVSAKTMTGQITLPVLLTSCAAIPAVIFGSKAGIWMSSSLNEYSYRRVLFVTLAGMGLSIMWSSLI